MVGDERAVDNEAVRGSSVALADELMRVIVGLWHDIDHNGGRAASTFFTAEAELRFADAVFRGTAEIDGVYANRKARGERVSRHLATNLHVVAAETD